MSNRQNRLTSGSSFFACLWQDLRYGVRTLISNRGFATAAIVSLALGVGATTAIFSIFDAIWLRPLPYEHADRLVAVEEVNLSDPSDVWPVALANYFDWKAQGKSFEYLTLAHMNYPLTLVGGDRAEEIVSRRVTDGYFDIFGRTASLGRLFRPEEYEEKGPPVVVLSHALWQRLFGADPGVLGKTLGLEGRRAYTVVGVMSPDYHTFWDSDIDLWIPINWRMKERTARYFPVIGRLKEGTDIRTAQAELDVVAGRLARQYSEQKGFGARIEPLRSYMYGDWGPRFWILFGAVAFVLLIACANVANLLLVRTVARDKEMAIRTSVGAGRLRLIRQMLTEGVLLAAVGAAWGLLVAFLGVKLLIGMAPESVPRTDEIGVNVRLFAFAAFVALLTGLLFSVAPALGASKPNLNESLKETGRRSASHFGGRRAHTVLVVVELALSFVLLTGAGLMIRDIWRVLHTDVGFNTENVITMQVALPMFNYMVQDAKGRQLKPEAALVRQRIQEQLRALPGAISASMATTPPLSGCLPRYVGVGSQPPPPAGRDAPFVCLHAVSPEYFQTLQIPVIKGRGFSQRDNETSPPVAVVSETMARRYFPGKDPLGRVLNLGRWDLKGNREPPLEVVGVVPDVRQSPIQQPLPAIYMPYSQLPVRFGGPNTSERTEISYVVRAGVKPASLEPAMRRVVSNVARDVVVSDVRTIEDITSESLQRTRLYTWLLVVFAGIAVTLAAVGVFGVMSYAVARRTHEIGIRLAVGAQPRSVLGLVARQAVLMTLAGVAIGWAGAFGLTRFLASLLFEVKPTDPVTFAAVSVVLCGVALVACVIPARRAAKVNPNTSLRYE